MKHTSILCLTVVSLVVSSVVVVKAQDEFNKVLGVAIDKGCMESVLFMPKACEAGGTSNARRLCQYRHHQIVILFSLFIP